MFLKKILKTTWLVLNIVKIEFSYNMAGSVERDGEREDMTEKEEVIK